jgi:molecular chaperone HtpG
MAAKKRKFKAEVNKILDLMIHSLYSHKEIFLRELISNASDAIDKVRYASLTDETLQEGDGEWRIQLIADKDAGTLTVRDNGIGMGREDIVEALGTIAHSGTDEFLKLLESREVKDNPELIGQFGVGFYSSFMVADAVTVLSRPAGAEPADGVRWQSNADSTYTLDAAEKETKGTDVILKLKDDAKEYLDEWEIRKIVKQYSDFIEYPVVMDVTRTKKDPEDEKKTVSETAEETLNSQKAIWLRDKSAVSEEEYNEFYKHISHDFSDPGKVIHYKAEGTTEFAVLLYLPKTRPFDIFHQSYKVGPMLYVRRVQIMDHCEDLIPPYLRFVKGVVESPDLPLNVSREILQNNRLVSVIRKNTTKSTEAGKRTTLAEYVERMRDGQDKIYYITGTDREAAQSSPYLEAFREKDYEVLIMTDEIDDIVITRLGTYAEKSFQSAIKGDIDLGEGEKEEQKKEFGGLLELVQDQLKEQVSEVRISGRLKDSAVCLVAGEHDMDPQMEKMLKAMGQDLPAGQRALEINPDHALIQRMNAMFDEDRASERLKEYIGLLYDQALLFEGDRPRDPVAFAKAVARLMTEGHSESGAGNG